MTAYAAAEQLGLGRQPALNTAGVSMPSPAEMVPSVTEAALLDQLLLRLADLVADRLAEQTTAKRTDATEMWMDTKQAADYLGVHRDTIRKLAAEHAVPAHQDGPGCKLYFRRDELDEWRGSSRPTPSRSHRRLRTVR